MSNVAIRAQNLSKQYRIGESQPQYRTIRESITDVMFAPLRRLKKGQLTTIWALKDLSFDVRHSEVVGIIGRNGAGKSTLLKILSRITHPTQGRAEIHGRVGSLLEVGTGFHPELTGRDNIYLNGAILGMKRVEILRKFDEIVAFAEIEKFLDTPVKRYSSGMYVRLAFAVAAHLEPEILLVDEVLAVGDAGFQKKCLNKMQDVGQEGRTVLFVSHNMAAITRLCQRAILLDDGHIQCDGPSPQVVSAYLHSGVGTRAAREWPDVTKAPGNDVARLRAVRVRAEDGRITDVLDIRRPFRIEIEYDVLKPGQRLSPVAIFTNDEGILVFSSADVSPKSVYGQDPNYLGRFVSSCVVPGNLLAEGTLAVTVSINAILDGNYSHASERDAVSFQVVDSAEGNSARGVYGGRVAGIVRPLLDWATEFKGPNTPNSINALSVESSGEKK